MSIIIIIISHGIIVFWFIEMRRNEDSGNQIRRYRGGAESLHLHRLCSVLGADIHTLCAEFIVQMLLLNLLVHVENILNCFELECMNV